MKLHAIFTTHGISDRATSPTHISTHDFRHFAETCRNLSLNFKPLCKNMFLPGNEIQSSNFSQINRSMTFDDALESVLKVTEIIPVKGTVFVVTGHVGKYNDWAGQPGWVIQERCLDWSQLRELQNDGWTIGSHTHSHPNLKYLTAKQIRNEIEFSKKTIEDKLGQSCDFFAYPYGYAPLFAQDFLQELNMIGLGTEPGWVDFNKSDFHYLPRIEIYDMIFSRLASPFLHRPPTHRELKMMGIKRFFGSIRRRIRRAT